MLSPQQAALEYAAMGYPVLPLEPGGKRPLARLVPHGLRDATTNPAIIRRWLEAEPRANIGILPPPEVLGLDVDAPERWPELLAEYPPLETTPRQHTPRGGVHAFMRLPQEAIGRISATVRRIEGVDLRGLGRAYLVAAPSTVGGRSYRWATPLVEPHRLPLVPPTLLERLLPPPPTPAPVLVVQGSGASSRRLEALLAWACSRVAGAPVGTRHTTLLNHSRLVGGWLHFGLDEAAALEALTQAGVAAGLGLPEARSTARDGLEYGRAAPLPLQQSRARLDELPPRLRLWMARRSRTGGAR